MALLAASPASTALEALAATLAGGMNSVNHVISAHLHSSVPLIPQLGDHLINAGGKRLRPLLTLATARLFNTEGDAAINLAAAVELIHTATLLHDDVVDASALRRGKQTANTLWGNKASILVGDFLFSRAFVLMVKANNINVLEVLARASATIAEGEVMQLAATRNLNLTEAGYFALITAKTAALFAAATEISGWLGGRSAAEIEAAARFGQHLGIAFQLVDDMLDYNADASTLGKAIGDDFRDGKVTLPVIYAYGQADAATRAFWQWLFQPDTHASASDWQQALDLLHDVQAFAYVQQQVDAQASLARTALLCLPAHPIRAALLDVLDFTAHRRY